MDKRHLICFFFFILGQTVPLIFIPGDVCRTKDDAVQIEMEETNNGTKGKVRGFTFNGVDPVAIAALC